MRAAVVIWTALSSFHCVEQTPTPPSRVPVVLEAEPAPDWNARFADKEGWIGGDGAYSLAFTRQRVLWFFGDSLLGAVKEGKRPGAVMVNNTVGVQVEQDQDVSIRFIAGKDREDKPTAIFRPIDGKGWFWPQAAVREGERLFVFLSRIDKGQERNVLGFRHLAQWLAVIDNAEDEPSRWRKKFYQVPFARFGSARVQSWGSAVLADGEHFYIYGYQEQGKKIDRRQLLAARVPANRLTDFAAWRFRTAGGWSEEPAEASSLASGLATEFSVTRLPDGKGYVLIYTENGLSDRIVGRWASSPAGPWSAPELMYRCPETARDRGVFCYAAKAHPWAGRKEELLISYCVNTWEFARLFSDEKVYRPRFVRVKLRTAK